MIFQKTAANITFTVEYSGHGDHYTVVAGHGSESVKGEVSFASLGRDFVTLSGYLFPKVEWLKPLSRPAFGKYLVQLGPDTKRDLSAAVLADYKERHPDKPKMTVEQIKARLVELDNEVIAQDDENAKHLNRLERSRLEWALKSETMTDAEKADLERKARISDWVLSKDYDNE